MKYYNRTISFAKKDIREIPFDELATACIDAAAHAIQQAREGIREAFLANKQSIANAVAKTGNITVLDDVMNSIKEQLPEIPKHEKHLLQAEAYRKECEKFCEKYTLKGRADWLPSQLVNTIKDWKPILADRSTPLAYGGRWIETSAGQLPRLFCPKATLRSSLGSSSQWMRGVYYFMLYTKRGSFIDAQYKSPGNQYCSLVPLILLGFRKYHNINYMEWATEGLEHILELSIYDVITAEHLESDYTADELLAVRDKGLLIKSGKGEGTYRSILSTYKLWGGLDDSRIALLPWLAQVMLTQIWCAHPENRHPNMVLDPNDMDNMPEPLISIDIFNKSPTAAVSVPAVVLKEDMPWNI